MKNRLKQQKPFMLFENSYTHLYVYWYHLISLYLLREFVLCTPCVMHRKFANRWLKVRPLVSLQLDGLWLAGPGSVALTAAEQAIPCPMQILGAPWRAQLLKNTWNPWRSQKWCRVFFILSVWWFHIFIIFTPIICGRFPFWLIFFKGVETTNQLCFFLFFGERIRNVLGFEGNEYRLEIFGKHGNRTSTICRCIPSTKCPAMISRILFCRRAI